MKIGSHVSFSSTGLLNAAQEAVSYGSTSFMIYTGAPQNTRRKPMEDQYITEGLAMMAEHGIEEIVVHAPYIINLASYKKATFQLAVDFLRNEINRTDYIGVPNIVLHPGAFTDKDPEYGIQRISEGLNEVLDKNQSCNIALETMAGKGSEIGRSFEEIATIMEKVDLNERLTVCFDTCHTHDAGYDIVHHFDEVMEEFDHIIGLDRLAVFHINDSKNEAGAGKDRHAPIGSGHIGYEAIDYIVHHEVAKNVPVILETPWIGKDKATKKPMYAAEIALLRHDETERFGQEYVDDVEKIEHFFRGVDIHPRSFVLETWKTLKDPKKKKEDKREPLERLYDHMLAEDLFPDYTEQAINYRLMSWLTKA